MLHFTMYVVWAIAWLASVFTPSFLAQTATIYVPPLVGRQLNVAFVLQFCPTCHVVPSKTHHLN